MCLLFFEEKSGRENRADDEMLGFAQAQVQERPASTVCNTLLFLQFVRNMWKWNFFVIHSKKKVFHNSLFLECLVYSSQTY